MWRGKEESTLARYQDMLDERILPYFGHRKVRDINGALLNRFYQELSKPGQNKKNGGTLSAKTILEYHRLLSTIFAEAKKLRIISANPAEDATPPKTPRKTPNYFQPEDLALIQQAFDEAPIKWRTLGYLFMNYGDRRSEFAESNGRTSTLSGTRFCFPAVYCTIRVKAPTKSPIPKMKRPGTFR